MPERMLAKEYYHDQGTITSGFLLQLVDDMQMLHRSTRSSEAVSSDAHAGQMDVGEETLEINLPAISQCNRNYEPLISIRKEAGTLFHTIKCIVGNSKQQTCK